MWRGYAPPSVSRLRRATSAHRPPSRPRAHLSPSACRRTLPWQAREGGIVRTPAPETTFEGSASKQPLPPHSQSQPAALRLARHSPGADSSTPRIRSATWSTDLHVVGLWRSWQTIRASAGFQQKKYSTVLYCTVRTVSVRDIPDAPTSPAYGAKLCRAHRQHRADCARVLLVWPVRLADCPAVGRHATPEA